MEIDVARKQTYHPLMGRRLEEMKTGKRYEEYGKYTRGRLVLALSELFYGVQVVSFLDGDDTISLFSKFVLLAPSEFLLFSLAKPRGLRCFQWL